MKELGQILQAVHSGEQGILATVVQVKGSAYRRPGARMLLLPDGRRIGSVSGGCLEGDLARKAWWLTESTGACLRTYDTSSGDDAIWEFGLGCNGVIDVLLERTGSPALAGWWHRLREARDNRETMRTATVIRGASTGARLWLTASGEAAGSLASSAMAPFLAAKLAAAETGSLLEVDGVQIYLEVLPPRQRLVIFGAGHDAIPLTNIACEMDWHITVADHRPAYAAAARFPAADSVILQRDADPLAGVDLAPQSAVVLMTHSYPRDRALLNRLLSHDLRYLGILGPRHRAERLFEELGEAPPHFVHAPTGLDIGAASPEMIALAIAAEISATLAARPGGKLRDRQSPIYDHPAMLETNPAGAGRAAVCEIG